MCGLVSIVLFVGGLFLVITRYTVKNPSPTYIVRLNLGAIGCWVSSLICGIYQWVITCKQLCP